MKGRCSRPLAPTTTMMKSFRHFPQQSSARSAPSLHGRMRLRERSGGAGSQCTPMT